ncbi:MAG: AMP-binding protein [Oscillospiraceae bacterium]|nr:AMP-binding protein [Oscillospiraceae bacterium]
MVPGPVVPIDKSLPANEIETLIIRSGAEAIFYTNTYDEIMNGIKERQSSDIRYFISMDLDERKDGVNSEYDLMRKGQKLLEDGDRRFLDATINTEEMAFLLFTSGTTSNSKGVMLSQKNICTNIMDIGAVLKVTPEDTILSFLPLHHTFECTTGFLYMLYGGVTIAYCDGPKHIANNLKEYEVSVMISVPALYEGIYKKVMKTLEQKGKLEDVNKARKLTSVLNKVGLDLRKKLFKELHATLGGKLRVLISGAAALDYEAERGFNELGFQLSQGYGLTETSPVVSAGDDFDRKLGSVGKVFPSVKVKIIDKNEEGVGEIIVKGPSVMLGYYQNEEATNEVLKKGWFYTGDLGKIDKKGFLYICGRKKSVIVLKNGKNIFPEEIESIINRIEGVKESFIYGKADGKSENDLKLCSKIVYDAEVCKEVYGTDDESAIEKVLWDKIKELNKTMPPYKYIKELIVSTEEIIKTTTLKIKRHEELEKIEKMKAKK